MSENMYDAWDNGDRHAIRQQFARREEIAKLYEKANGWSPAAYLNTMEDLERFAALVAAQEREACARACETAAELIWEYHPEQVKTVGESVCTNLAAAIRARGD